MNTNKVAYWVAVGALALGLNGEYRHGSFESLHRFADRTGSALCRVSTQTERTLAFARVLMSGDAAAANTLVASMDEARTAQAQGDMVRYQARVQAIIARDSVRDSIRNQIRDQIRAQADVLRAQAETRRAEIERIRWTVQSQNGSSATRNRSVTISCPEM